jgi:hypothetical protein
VPCGASACGEGPQQTPARSPRCRTTGQERWRRRRSSARRSA